MRTLAVAALVNGASAWWGKGHLLTARVAFDVLQKEGQDTIDNVLNGLAVLEASDPNNTKLEGKHPFVECVTYADEMKSKGGSYQSGWHFIDTPYLDNSQDINDYKFKADSHNITEALHSLTDWFNRDGDYKSSYEYQQVMDHRYHSTQEADGLSSALRLVMHYIGDIHQPLHATSRVDDKYPAGDRGGNSFPVKPVGDAHNLHSVWDSVGFEFVGREVLPYSDSDWKQLGEDAAKIAADHPVNATVANNLNFESWAEESYQISANFVYKGIVEGEALPADYVAGVRSIAESQISVGGHRLANYLKKLSFAGFPKKVDVGYDAFLQ